VAWAKAFARDLPFANIKRGISAAPVAHAMASRPPQSPLRRATRYTVAILCLAVAIAATILWIRSPRRADYARLTTPSRHYLFITFPGGVRFSTWPGPLDPPGVALTSYEYDVRNAAGAWTPRPTVSWSRLGFDLQPVHFSNKPNPEPRAFELGFPFWFPLLTALAIPAWLHLRHRRRLTRARTRHCPECGYDLRASTDRCPECGTTFPAS
jgi:hypothetical protein